MALANQDIGEGQPNGWGRRGRVRSTVIKYACKKRRTIPSKKGQNSRFKATKRKRPQETWNEKAT